MTERVPADKIENLVGRNRDSDRHFARLDSDKNTMYILHSQRCVDSTPDLRDCPLSVALDKGILHYIMQWEHDRVLIVDVTDGILIRVFDSEEEN